MVGEATTIDLSDFERVDMRVGGGLDAEPFPEARKPAYKPRSDLSPLGTRRSTCELTRTMSRTMAILDIPCGGAKAGIDCGPASAEAPAVLRGFIEAIRPFIAERYATGADLGTREDDIIAACQLAGLTHPLQAGFKAEAGAGLTRLKQPLPLTTQTLPPTQLIPAYAAADGPP